VPHHPSTNVSSLEVRRTVPQFSFGRPSDAPDETVSTLFERQVEANPLNIAIEDGKRSINYRDLDSVANHLAELLRRSGIRRGEVAGVFGCRSTEMVIGILAILKIGAAYAVQDARIAPSAQLAHIAATTRMRVVLSTPGYESVAPEGTLPILIDDVLAEHSADRPKITGMTSADTCAVIFTSGTTGTPNGVIVTHGNFVNLFSPLRCSPTHR
jgi:D-alanine--poly(phosphoribitol) ligase subunit 1